jgi:CDP-glycerol glycerophosphotransferase (TagB/SpsB family)
MGTANKRVHKHFQLDAAKIRRAQKVFQAKTETEAIECALDFAIDEHEKNRLAVEANERFVRSGVEIRDVYGKLAD